MPTKTIFLTAPPQLSSPDTGARGASPSPTPQADLHYLRSQDLFRCAVPTRYGGLGGQAHELGALMSEVCKRSMSAALLFWSQRLAIEFLLQSANGALREYLLPDLLSGERAATVPLPMGLHRLQAHDTGRGWQLSGQGLQAMNAAPHGFSFVAPVQMGPTAGWCLLRSEEDGFDVHSTPSRAWTARIDVRQVFFREDEWLGDSALEQAVHPVRMALGRVGEHLQQHVELI